MTHSLDAPDIRLARPEEYERVGEITVEAYRALEGFNNETGYETELRDVAGRVRDAEVFVALRGIVVVGGITFVAESTSALSEWEDEGAAGIRMLAIDPSAQGLGIGRKMTEFTIERARALGKKRMLLHSADIMRAAHGLYESMGFVRAPEIDFSVETVNLIGYRLEL